jgi:SAM-dependent methyltransferase
MDSEFFGNSAWLTMSRRIRNLGSVIVDDLREDFIRRAFAECQPGAALLDLGCGTRPFRELYEHCATLCIGTDVPFSYHDVSVADVYSMAHALPFASAVFDIVLCTEMLEHVPDPAAVLSEIRRILKPGGRLIMTTPFLVPLHEEPHDFFRYTSHGLKHLCASASLEIRLITPFAGLTGVVISFLVQAQLKAWYMIYRAIPVPGLYSIYNPFIFLFIYLPQRLYMLLLRSMTRLARFRRLHEKLSYTTKGYGLIAVKK